LFPFLHFDFTCLNHLSENEIDSKFGEYSFGCVAENSNRYVSTENIRMILRQAKRPAKREKKRKERREQLRKANSKIPNVVSGAAHVEGETVQAGRGEKSVRAYFRFY